MSAGEQAADLARRLHELDQEIDEVRRRLYAVQKGLARVSDPRGEIAALEARFRDLGDEFVETYRLWQASERRLDAE